MDDAEPEVRVTDRRHFTAEGDLRSDSAAEAPDESLRPAAETTGRDPAAQDPAVQEDEARPDPFSASDSGPVTFPGFIISLATQAATLLGAEKRDLQGARQIISVLEMLKDKTEGRRTEEESKILDLVLFDLRMAFVGSAKGPHSGELNR